MRCGGTHEFLLVAHPLCLLGLAPHQVGNGSGDEVERTGQEIGVEARAGVCLVQGSWSSGGTWIDPLGEYEESIRVLSPLAPEDCLPGGGGVCL